MNSFAFIQNKNPFNRTFVTETEPGLWDHKSILNAIPYLTTFNNNTCLH